MDNPGSQFADEVPAGELPPVLQRRPLYKRTDEDAKPSDQLASVIVYLSSLHAEIMQTEQKEVSGLAPQRAASVLQEKRLSRTGAALVEDFAKFGQRSDAGHPISPLATRPEAFNADRPARFQAGWKALLGTGCVGFLCAVALFEFWPRAFPSMIFPSTPIDFRAAGNVVRAPEAGEASPEAGAVADQVLDAIQHGRVMEASSLLEGAHRRRLRLPGMNYQGALLAFHQGDESKAEDWIDAAIAANEFVPECLYLRANHAAAAGDFEEAVKAMEAAARAAPFTPRYFFFWAECLRRKGNPALALPQFNQALRCRPTTADADLILFKMRLAIIESGKDANFEKQLADKLGQEPVSPDTLLLAAANEVNRSAYPAAAGYLRRAASLLPPATLRLRLRDYLFRAQANRPDLAKVWTDLLPPNAQDASKPAKASVCVDPATRGLGEADPSGW